MQRIREITLQLVTLVLVGLAAALLMPRAYAGMIGSDAAQPSQERAQVKAILARPELAKELQKMGIAPQEALSRVDAMSDAEVSQLAGRLSSLPAGGELSTQDILIIVIIVLLAVIIF